MASGVIMDQPTTDSARDGTRPSPTRASRWWWTKRSPSITRRRRSASGARNGVALSEIRAPVATAALSRKIYATTSRPRWPAPPRPAGTICLSYPRWIFPNFGPIELRPLGRIRRATAASVQRSWRLVPHVTQYDEADITDLEAFRKAEAEQAKQRGVRLDSARLLHEGDGGNPERTSRFNASLDATAKTWCAKRYYHLGIAVDTSEGLVVPVVRDVDRKRASGSWPAS